MKIGPIFAGLLVMPILVLPTGLDLKMCIRPLMTGTIEPDRDGTDHIHCCRLSEPAPVDRHGPGLDGCDCCVTITLSTSTSTTGGDAPESFAAAPSCALPPGAAPLLRRATGHAAPTLARQRPPPPTDRILPLLL